MGNVSARTAEVEQRAEIARAKIVAATAGDLEWLAVAQVQHNIAHNKMAVPMATYERWDAVQALEELARTLEHAALTAPTK